MNFRIYIFGAIFLCLMSIDRAGLRLGTLATANEETETAADNQEPRCHGANQFLCYCAKNCEEDCQGDQIQKCDYVPEYENCKYQCHISW